MKVSKKQRLLELKKNPLLNEAIRSKSLQYLAKFQQQGISLVESISKQDQYDLMMTILDKDCEERSNLEVHILTHIISDIRFFRDIRQSTSDADETCFKLCKYMQGLFLQKEQNYIMQNLSNNHYLLLKIQVLFKQGDKGDTFWIIIKGEVRIYKNSFQKQEEQPEGQDHQDKLEENLQEYEGNKEDLQPIEIELVRLGSGNCFGEFALDPNKNKRRQASVATTFDTFFGFIKGDKIIDIIQKINNSSSFIECFSRIKILQGYPYEILKQFYDISDEINDIPEYVYFVKEGEFSIFIEKDFKNEFKQVEKESLRDTQNESDNKNIKQKKFVSNSERGKFVQLKLLGQGECFGEEEIIKKRGAEYFRIYRVVCNSETGVLYVMSKKSLFRVLHQHPSVFKAMSIQTKNKEQARLFRIKQLSATRYQNEEVDIDGTIRPTEDIPIQDTFNEKPHLFINFSKQKKLDNSLSKTVKLAKNCELAEDIFKQDEHNYLIYHSKIANNQFLPKNPKIRKEDASDDFGEDGSPKLNIKEIDKNRYIRMIDLKYQEHKTHETRSTLLYEENLKKKKVNQNHKPVSLFEEKYLKDFSIRFNIPPQELTSSTRNLTRQKSSTLTESLTESAIQRRNTTDFLIKANQQKSLLQENAKSKFYSQISQESGLLRTISVTQREIGDNNDQGRSPKNQRSQSSFYSNYYGNNSPLTCPDTNQRGKVPKLKLDEMKGENTSILQGSTDYIKNDYLRQGSQGNSSILISPRSKTFTNNTPKTQRSPTEIFKFLKPEYISPYPKKQLQLLNEIKQLPQLSINPLTSAQAQQPNKGFNQNNQYVMQKAISLNRKIPHQNQICNFSQAYLSQERKNNFTISNNMQTNVNEDQSQITQYTERKTQRSPPLSITKLLTPGITKQNTVKPQEQKLGMNSIHSQKTLNTDFDFDYSKLLLKNAAEDIFKSKLPSTIRIKKFQLSNTFKNFDKQIPFGKNQGQLPQPQQLTSNKYKFLSRQNSPLK